MLAPCKKQRYLGRRETEKYLGRREKGVKKFREKGDRNLGDIGPIEYKALQKSSSGIKNY